jgi:hypothetical protein
VESAFGPHGLSRHIPPRDVLSTGRAHITRLRLARNRTGVGPGVIAFPLAVAAERRGDLMVTHRAGDAESPAPNAGDAGLMDAVPQTTTERAANAGHRARDPRFAS